MKLSWPGRKKALIGTAISLGLIISFVFDVIYDPPDVVINPISPGGELVYVFIASSDCIGIHDSRLPGALTTLREYIRERARLSGRNVVTVGIAIDRDVQRGMRLLEYFGPFDEVHIGRSYLNAAAVEYLEDLPGPAAVPQVVVVQRRVGGVGGLLDIHDEEVLLRKVGSRAIVEWSRVADGTRQ